ncbi:MAG TPA: methyltransferase domain-containing protein [Promineifilum sp.]
MDVNQRSFNRFKERYSAGNVPWDNLDPPPEVVSLSAELVPGLALDLGCGYGRTAIFLARLGWSAVGVDFIPHAVEVARARAAAAGVAHLTRFHVASATDLSFLNDQFDLAIDIGCMHSFTDEQLAAYRDELVRLLRPGAVYLLFARLITEPLDDHADGPRGIREGAIHELFAESFVMKHVEHGSTQVQDQDPWDSAWFRFQRLGRQGSTH